jgi:NADH-quinone oxidoreductase subunit N
MTAADLGAVMPEILLALASMGFLMVGAFRGEDQRAEQLCFGMAGFLIVLGLALGIGGEGTAVAFGGSFVSDAYARVAKVLILVSAGITLALSVDYFKRRDLLRFELPVLVGLATLGMMVMVSANDLMVLYLGVELQSLALYVIAAFRRDSARSTEAGLKYFVLGALSSGMLLYGASLIYGFTGTVSFDGIGTVVAAEGVGIGLLFGLAFLCAGLAFKISAAPFHMWTPDVYEGSPTPVTAFFAAAPKVAAGVLFVRVLYGGFGEAAEAWRQIIVFVALMSMFWGGVAAIGQTNLKRLMAYSSIGHMGYALVGLAAGTESGAAGVLIYLAIYVVMTIGVFAYLMCMERDGRPVVEVGDLAGLSGTAPGHAVALAALMFSLAGIPPLAGFFAKYFVFVAAVEAGLAPLAVAGAVASVISAFYYLRIVKVMYIDEPGEALDNRLPTLHGAALAGSALLMALGWLPFVDGFGLTELSADAAAALMR